MANQWNPADKDATVTISGAGLVATSTSGQSGVRAINSWSTGKHSFSITGVFDSAGCIAGVSIAGSSRTYTDTNGLGATYYGALGGWIGIQSGGAAFNDGGASPAPGTGNVTVTVHVDSTNNLIYFQAASGFLFGGNPAAGTGGRAIVAGPHFPNGVPLQALGPATINFNPTSLPSGYTAWGNGNNTAAYTMPAATGAFVLSGKTATLKYSGAPLASSQWNPADIAGGFVWTISPDGMVATSTHDFSGIRAIGGAARGSGKRAFRIATPWVMDARGYIAMSFAGAGFDGETAGSVLAYLSHGVLSMRIEGVRTPVTMTATVDGVNDVATFYVDLDNHKLYWDINGTYEHGTNPVTETGGFTIPAGDWIPGTYDVFAGGTFTLIPNPTGLPAGWIAWDSGVTANIKMPAGTGTFALSGGGASSPPAFRSSASTGLGSRTNTTVSLPAGVVNGDILILSVGMYNNPTAPPTATLPAGFTQIDTTVSASAGGDNISYRIAWKRAASEGSSYTITHAASGSEAFIAAYSGAIASGSPIDLYSKATGTTGGSITASSITTTVSNTELLYLSHNWSASATLSPPTGFTERYDSLVYAADKTNAPVGATGTASQTNNNFPWAAFQVALKPPASAATNLIYGGRRIAATTRSFALAGQVATLTKAGATGVTGTMAATEAADTSSATGTVRWQATLGATETADAAAITAATRWLATLAATETADTASATALVRWLATLSANETADGAAITGAIIGTGTLAATEAADIFAATGLALSGVGGTLSATETADVAALTGQLAGSAGALAASETADSASATGQVRWQLSLAASETPDSAAMVATVRWQAMLAATETPDSAAFAGPIAINGNLAATEATDAASLTGFLINNAAMSAVEAPDGASLTGAIRWQATLAATEAADVAAMSGSAGWAATLAATDAADVAAFSGDIRLLIRLSATEAPDIASIFAGAVTSMELVATETADRAFFTSAPPSIQDAPGHMLRSGDRRTRSLRNGSKRVRAIGYPAKRPNSRAPTLEVTRCM